ncbi:MAG: TIGR03936 family radical SAM-associated protein, partial [Evtepia sp.]|nr:TIGR03936 family radical SAM-associated protein [Evtepia sp.]MDR3998264.1 TIGR03936 family radical SAM-associated protein [Evtepia sp.]
PYVSIPLPLPLGFSSQCELMEFGLEEGCTMEELPQKMNQVLPAGIVIHDCYEGGLPFRALSFVRYDISLEFDGNLAQAAGEAFQELVSRDHFIVQKRSKKSKRGFTEVDLIPLIEGVETVQAQGDTLSLTLLLQAQNPGLSPSVLLQGFQTAYPSFVPVYSSCHRREILDQEKNVYR